MPPDRRGGAPTPESARHHHRRQSLIKDQHPQPNAAPRHHGRYAHAWREGFGYGFLDALRLAARRTDDPDVWVMLSRLGEEYTLAGGDD
jgi:hypothetical protein